MNRRKFVKAGTSATLTPALLLGSRDDVNGHLNINEILPLSIYEHLVRENDKRGAELLPRQESDPRKKGIGGLPDSSGIYSAGGTAGLIKVLASALVEPASRYFQSSLLQQRLIMAVNFMLHIQHTDGTFVKAGQVV